MKILISILLASAFVFGGYSDSGNNNGTLSFIPETNLAQEFTIIKISKYPTPPTKSGLEITIYSPKATTFKKRAQTVIKAAKDILKEKGLYEVVVRMSISKNLKKFKQIARAKYTPHKKNTWGDDEKYVWSVEASKNTIKNGKLIEDGKSYPIAYITVKKYLQK